MQYSASGCSIDKQVQFIKELEKKYSLILLDRLLVAYKKEDEILVTHSSKIPQLLTEGLISKNTPVFNIALSNEEELDTVFETPIKDIKAIYELLHTNKKLLFSGRNGFLTAKMIFQQWK